MKNYFLNYSIKLILNNFPHYPKEKIDKINYGLEGFYLTITKTIIIFSIAFLLNIFLEFFILLIIYNFLRLFSFGLHANTSITCLIVSMTLFIGGAFLTNLLIISNITKTIIFILAILIFFKYSPADSKKRPLINKKKRSKYKFISTFIIIIMCYITYLPINNYFNNAIIIAIIYQAFLITPFAYYLFKQPYNNYLYREEVI